MNLAERIQDYRRRRLYARRLVRVMDYLERRALRRVSDLDVCFTTLKDWSDRNGCSIQQAAVRRVQMRAALLASMMLLLLCNIAASQNVALLPPPLPPVPKGETFTLAWDASPSSVDGYRIYSNTNKTAPVWKLVATTTNTTATVSNVIMPTWWHARAFAGAAESTNSNIIGWTTNYQVLTVIAQSSSNLTTWSTLGTLTTRTNPAGQTFFRTAAQLKTFKRIE